MLISQILSPETPNYYFLFFRLTLCPYRTGPPGSMRYYLLHTHEHVVKHHLAKAGITSRYWLPITPFIRRELFSIYNHTKRPRCLCASGGLLVGFLRAVEFPTSFWEEFDQGAHLMVMDVAIDSHAHLSILQVHVNEAKQTAFHKGIHINIVRCIADICPVTTTTK